MPDPTNQPPQDPQQAQPAQTPQPQPGGVSIWTALVVLFILVLLVAAGLAGMGYYIKSGKLNAASIQRKRDAQNQKIKDQQARDEMAREKGEEEARLTLARNRQDDVLQTVRKSTNVFGTLMVDVGGLEQQLQSLKTNREGRAISSHPDLVAQAIQLYKDQARRLPEVSEIADRWEGARRIEQQLLSMRGSPFNPDSTLTSAAQDGLVWAESQAQSVDDIKATLAGLQRDAKAKLTSVADAPTLQDAMTLQIAAEQRARNEMMIKATAAAQLQETRTLAEAQSNSILAKAEAMKTDSEIERQRVLQDAKKKMLREKPSRADIRDQLAAYLTPGYFLPPPRGAMGSQIQRSYDKKPMSYSKLRELGALAPTMDGLHEFVRIGVNRANDRPRLPDAFLLQYWDRKPELLDQARNLQKLMIELVPTFVEMHLMEK
jgi:hypothetical protein